MNIITKIKSHWFIFLLFLLLPTLNGCQPSFGYPFAVAPIFQGYDGWLFFIFIVFSVIANVTLFMLYADRIAQYFQNNIRRIVFASYFLYEAIVLFLLTFGSGSISLEYVDVFDSMYTLSQWIMLGLWVIDESTVNVLVPGLSLNPFAFFFYRFISMLILTGVLFLVSYVIERIFRK